MIALADSYPGTDAQKVAAANAAVLAAGGGVVELSERSWDATGTWVIGIDEGPCCVSLRGQGNNTVVRCRKGAAIRLARSKDFLPMRDFRLIGPGPQPYHLPADVTALPPAVPRDRASIGILVDSTGPWNHGQGPPPSGTLCNGGGFERLVITGFDYGMLAGDKASGRAASEMTLRTVRFEGDTWGLSLEGFNTLNWRCENLQGDGCGVLLSGGDSASGIYVTGGSASSSQCADFAFGAAGSNSINGFRSEAAQRLCLRLAGSTNLPLAVDVGGLEVAACANPVLVQGCVALAMSGGRLSGPLRVIMGNGAAGATIDLRSVPVEHDGTTPVWTPPVPAWLKNVALTIMSCQRLREGSVVGTFNHTAGVYDDQARLWGAVVPCRVPEA